MTEPRLRPATDADAPGVTACVCEAYVHYIERIGKQPRPMLDDYREVIASSQVHVAERDGRIVGVIVLKITDEGFFIDNIAVRPAVKGAGVGRLLLELAEREARRHGYDSIYLSTHELMVENRALYARIGYVEFDRRVMETYSCVLMRKPLSR